MEIRVRSIFMFLLLRTCQGFGSAVTGPLRRQSCSSSRSLRTKCKASPDGLPDLPSLPAMPSLPLPTISQAVWDEAAKTLLNTTISWAVPAIAIGLVLGLAAAKFGAKAALNEARDKSIRRARVKPGLPSGAAQKGRGLMGLLGGGGAGDDSDLGAPEEFLKVERLNDKFDSFAYSLEKATVAPATAIAAARRRDLVRRFGDEIGLLNDSQMAALVRAEEIYKEKAKEASAEIQEAAKDVRLNAIAEGTPQKSQQPSSKDTETKDDSSKKEPEMPMMKMFRAMELEKKLQAALKKSVSAEAEYLKTVSAALGGFDGVEEERLGLARLVTDRPFVWDPDVAPLELPHRNGVALASSEGESASTHHAPPCVFVLEFFGDIQASQVQNLRQEVTAIVQQAKPERGDSVVLILNTGGGTVTGYGLAAAQLQRIKAAGLKLTICVEQVAASGGYMMACIADRLVAAPFAVLGSIGVITDIPNVYDRLLKEGIEFQTITAGKFKRTLTPTKKVTEEDKKKTTEDVEAIFKLFRGFVGENRPQLDLEKVATGETWFGQDALERNLVDELMAPDDVLLQLRKDGAELFSVKYSPAPSSPLGALLSANKPDGVGVGGGSPSGGALGWWAQRLLEFATGSPPGALAQSEYSTPDRAFRAEDRSSDSMQMRGF
eukprot:TRINITY_DN79246_c0_g1_i1.p1 TRINITY_DN79246_c0_g1~~TRINITY_DN79246_c0_g1_i1.p1  ORF type:complete len:662 (-),score=132.83 TRINITY_DN79246_c0_g1_i1:85-2070(-)